MGAICTIGIRLNFSSNRRHCTPSNKMASIWPRRLYIWPIRCRKTKEDNRRKRLEESRVMQITLEQVGFRWMVWVLGIMSLMSMVQCSTQHHQSIISRLTHQNCLMVK